MHSLLPWGSPWVEREVSLSSELSTHLLTWPFAPSDAACHQSKSAPAEIEPLSTLGTPECSSEKQENSQPSERSRTQPLNQMQMLGPDGFGSETLVASLDMLHPAETVLALAGSDLRYFHTLSSGDHATLGCTC